MANWKVELSGRFTVRSSTHEFLLGVDSATERAEQFIAEAEPDESKRRDIYDAVILAEPGEPVTLPNGKKLEIIDLGEQF